MANLELSPVWEDDIYRIDYTDPVQGYTASGGDGVANQQPKQLGNRTEYLKSIAELAASTYELPFAALPYPTIATATNRMTVTPSAATNGGRVSVPDGTRITLAEQTTEGETGRLRAWVSEAWQSADLLVSSTYYLRVQVTSGALVFYVQRGADTDAIPASQMGTPNGSSGGGFDSTPIDMLVAKVVTGTATTTPTVTTLANAAQLRVSGYVGMTDVGEGTLGVDPTQYTPTTTVTLNWARTPMASIPGFSQLFFDPSGGTGQVNRTLCVIPSREQLRFWFLTEGASSNDGIRQFYTAWA